MLSIESLQVPNGFELLRVPTTPLAPGTAETLRIGIDTSMPGYHAGEVVLESNDADESSYRFSIEARVKETGKELLWLGIGDRQVAEGHSTVGTIWRSGDLSSDLAVNLQSSDSSEIVFPPTVTILAGQAFAKFNMDGVDDALLDGNQFVELTAAAIRVFRRQKLN